MRPVRRPPSDLPHTGTVVAVCADDDHRFSKPVRSSIELVAGHGVVGDAHAGATVRHRSRVRRAPEQPNLRQVHLLSVELLERMADRGHVVQPGDVGENVLTRGVDLHALPVGTTLRLGNTAAIELTGLRNPCWQLDAFQGGLQAAVLDRGDDGELLRRAGVMAVVVASGEVTPGDEVAVELPAGTHRPLAVV